MVGVVLGFINNDGVFGLFVIVGYGIMVVILKVMVIVMGVSGIDIGVLGGILAGGVVVWLFNCFYKI